MASKHLTEEEIREIIVAGSENLSVHLQNCSVCKEKFKKVSTILNSMKDVFDMNVMQKQISPRVNSKDEFLHRMDNVLQNQQSKSGYNKIKNIIASFSKRQWALAIVPICGLVLLNYFYFMFLTSVYTVNKDLQISHSGLLWGRLKLSGRKLYPYDLINVDLNKILTLKDAISIRSNDGQIQFMPSREIKIIRGTFEIKTEGNAVKIQKNRQSILLTKNSKVIILPSLKFSIILLEGKVRFQKMSIFANRKVHTLKEKGISSQVISKKIHERVFTNLGLKLQRAKMKTQSSTLGAPVLENSNTMPELLDTLPLEPPIMSFDKDSENQKGRARNSIEDVLNK